MSRIRQYIGARYVIKIYENSNDPSTSDWEANMYYEPLTMVTYNYSSYISKKDVPNNIGNPTDNPEYWALSGFYNGQISSLQTQIDDINQKKLGVVNVSNFYPELNGADDTTAVQNAFDYAKDHNMTLVSFRDISEISFKNVEIKSDCTIMLGNCAIQALQLVGERADNVFTIDSNIHVNIIGGTFRGLYENGGNEGSGSVEPIIKVLKASSININDVVFTHINNRCTGVPSDIVDRTPIALKIMDCRNTKIERCNFDYCVGEELIYIIDKDLDRVDINAAFKNNIFGSNINTSALDFIGNNLELSGNVYNFDYTGSVINAFALDLYAHDETINGDVDSVYDTCEQTFFTNNIVKIENINIEKCRIACEVATKYLFVDNIRIHNKHTGATNVYYVLFKGGSGGTLIHKDVASSDVVPSSIEIRNLDTTYLNTTGVTNLLLFNSTIAFGNMPMLAIKNCNVRGLGEMIIAKNWSVEIENCKLRPHVISSYSDSYKVCFGIKADENMRHLKVIGCSIEGDSGSGEYLMYNNITPYSVVGNVSTRTCGINMVGSPSPAHAQAGNANLT